MDHFRMTVLYKVSFCISIITRMSHSSVFGVKSNTPSCMEAILYFTKQERLIVKVNVFHSNS